MDAPKDELDRSSQGAGADDAQTGKPVADQILGRWVHSHEEDPPGQMVFRRGDRAFPPSRGRVSLALEPEGVVVVGGPGPDDRHTATPGRWALDGSHLSVNAPGWSGDFDVLEAEDDKLVVRSRQAGGT